MYYTIQRTLTPQKYRIIKFDKDHNIEAIYKMQENPRKIYCDCPAGWRGRECKHADIFRKFRDNNKISTGWFWNIDSNKWEGPLE